MKDCQKIRKNIVAFLYGELGPDDQVSVKAHLDVCSHCREEAAALEFVRKESGSLFPGMSKAMSSVDWESLPGSCPSSPGREVVLLLYLENRATKHS